MQRPPRPAHAHLIDRRVLTGAYVWLGPLQAAFVMASFLVAYRLMGVDGWTGLPDSGSTYQAATAMALAAVVATQIGNLFAQRTARGFLSMMRPAGNPLLLWGIASEILVIAAIVYVPVLQNVIGTAPFPAAGWLWLLAGVPLLPLAQGIRRRITRRALRRP